MNAVIGADGGVPYNRRFVLGRIAYETSETETEYDMGEIRVKVLLTNSVDEALLSSEEAEEVGSQALRGGCHGRHRRGTVNHSLRMSWRLSASCLAATGSPNMPMGGPRLLP